MESGRGKGEKQERLENPWLYDVITSQSILILASWWIGTSEHFRTQCYESLTYNQCSHSDFYWPFCQKFGERIGKSNPAWHSLVGPIPNEVSPFM